jgi:hypothetical protein
VKASLKTKLERLRADYAQMVGRPFEHFYCPVLFRDEEVELCTAHIVPKAFPHSPRTWTVQRKDVDSFYGTNFEDDFLAIRYRIEGQSPQQILTDETLSRRFRPKIFLEGKPVDHFIARHPVPGHLSPLEFHSNGKCVLLGLKMARHDAAGVVGHRLEIQIEKNASIPSVVSLIKAAHLTLFDMLGYRYALSGAGHFVGRRILGEFFLQSQGKRRAEVADEALVFFRQFAHMVRPVRSHPDLRGTATDRNVLICWDGGNLAWALAVFVRTSHVLHAVLIPLLESEEAAAIFNGFLDNQTESVDVSYCRLGPESWEVKRGVQKLAWPKGGMP